MNIPEVQRKVRILMKRNKLTLRHLGTIIDPDHSTDYHAAYARAKRFTSGEGMTVRRLQNLAKYFGIPLSELIEDTKKTPTKTQKTTKKVANSSAIPLVMTATALIKKDVDLKDVRGWVQLPMDGAGQGMRAIMVQGVTMEPVLAHGDMLFVMRTMADQVANGKVMVMASVEQGIILGRWYRREEGIEIRPENPQFPSVWLTPDEVAEMQIFFIVGKITQKVE